MDIDQLLANSTSLKAKEIAKKLGLQKSDVNVFLYSNLDRYSKNDDHQWSRIQYGCRTICLQPKWITSKLLEESLGDGGDIFDGDHKTIKFVFPQGCKLMIDALARLLSLMNQLAKREKTVIVDFTDCYDTQSYLNRAGFFDLLHENIEVNPERPQKSAAQLYKGNSENLVELGLVNPGTDNDDLKNQLTNTFVNLSSDQFKVAAYTVFSELIDNVRDHSETPISGFAGLQKYGKSKKRIQIVISDSGVGIANTLRSTLQEHHPKLHEKFSSQSSESNADLIAEVMSCGEISRFGEGRGLGFKSSKEQANKFNAQFTVRQDRFSLNFVVENGKIKKVTQTLNLSLLHGTHICFDFLIE